MKKISLIIASVFVIVAIGKSQNAESVQEISTPVQSAIIYLYGAEVTHSKQVTLNAGRNKIVFVGLSTKLNAKSIQVNNTGDASILAISDAINYFANQKESTKIKQLKDSVQMLTEAISQLNNDKDAYTIEKDMLLKNESIGSKDKGVVIAELKLAADFYLVKIKEINSELLKIQQKTTKLNELLVKSNQELMELNAKNNQPTAEISILISSPIKTTTTIELKYIVTDCGWTPSYDLRAEDINQPIQLKYRAKVFNNTGIDWNDIKVKLSTADPSQSAAKPILTAWNLNFDMGYGNKGLSNSIYQSSEGYFGNTLSKDNNNNEISTQPQAAKTTIAQPVKFQEIEVSELSAEFDIKNNYTIPADSKPYIVDVTEYKLPAVYQHFSVPKLDKNAFLLARINGWEDLNLVEGPANVYYSGTYVGQSYIYTRSADDTLDLSLGRDNKVLVTRSKVKEYCNKKILGNFVKETFAYEMVIKNNRKTPVQIEIDDQLPVSTQSDITVEALETSKGLYDTKTGKYSWTYTLQPGDVKKIAFSFSVKYPRNTRLPMEKMKRAMRADF